MRTRPGWPEDAERIRELHRRAGYGFTLPDPTNLQALTCVEEDGRVLGAAGYTVVAQVVGVLDPELPPHRKLAALKALHLPMAKALLRSTVQEAYVFLDPQFRNFEKRMNALGWHRKLWRCMFVERRDMQLCVGLAEGESRISL